jgi:hypothetical protein
MHNNHFAYPIFLKIGTRILAGGFTYEVVNQPSMFIENNVPKVEIACRDLYGTPCVRKFEATTPVFVL